MRRRGKNRIWSIVMAACCVIAAGCVAMLMYMGAEQKRAQLALDAASSADDRWQGELGLPVSFSYLRSLNPDVAAWLDMPLCERGYPVMRCEGDDAKYWRRDIYGRYSSNGSLFVESLYNGASMDDDCLVIYGHNMLSGEMLGDMAEAVRSLTLDEDRKENTLTLYTPDAVRSYRIVCAGEYPDESILYAHDFSDAAEPESFLTALKNYAPQSFVRADTVSVSHGDKLLVLSTCPRNATDRRILIVSVLTEKRTGGAA